MHPNDSSNFETKHDDIEPKVDVEQIQKVLTEVVAVFWIGNILYKGIAYSNK